MHVMGNLCSLLMSVLLIYSIGFERGVNAAAEWPIKSYSNGTVTMKSESGEIIMNTGTVKISGSLEVNGRNVETVFNQLAARIEGLSDNVVKLNLPCDKAGTQNASYDVETQVFFNCNCKSGYSGYLCAALDVEPFHPLQISSLTHWFDFSSKETYGSYNLTKVSGFTDICSNATEKTVNGNVAYRTNGASSKGLGAIYVDASKTALSFKTSKVGKNPEIFIAYRVVAQTGSVNSVHQGILFRNEVANNFGYGFGSYKQSIDYVATVAADGSTLSSVNAPYSAWHVANIYYGETDGFLQIDNSTTSTFGISGKYEASALTLPSIGGSFLSANHHASNFVGEVLIFKEKLSSDHRELMQSYLMTKWTNFVIVGNNTKLYKDADGWLLLLAYKHVAGESKKLVPGVVPQSPTDGYSHVWLENIGLSASDVESVRFYCTSSGHSRTMDFSVNNNWIKTAIVDGNSTGNSFAYWYSGRTTKLSGHSALLPDYAYSSQVSPYCPYTYSESASCPFSLLYKPFSDLSYNFAIVVDENLQGAYIPNYERKASFLCDDNEYEGSSIERSTLHQIWFKLKEEKEIEDPQPAVTFEDCKAKGGASLTYNYSTATWACNRARYPHYRDSWYRSPFLYGNSSYPTKDVVLSYLKNMTKCSREVHGENYLDCSNPKTDWREVYIVNPAGTTYGSYDYDGENCTVSYTRSNQNLAGVVTSTITSTTYKNSGQCNYWKCNTYQSYSGCSQEVYYSNGYYCPEYDYTKTYEWGYCGIAGDDTFYGKNKTMITVSEEYYSFEQGRQTTINSDSKYSTRFYAQKYDSDVLLYFGETWMSNYDYSVSFTPPETAEYRIVAVTISTSCSTCTDEGVMLWIKQWYQQKPTSCGWQCSSYYDYFWQSGSSGSCYGPYANGEYWNCGGAISYNY